MRESPGFEGLLPLDTANRTLEIRIDACEGGVQGIAHGAKQGEDRKGDETGYQTRFDDG